ncbi:hypothetical protein DAEQUDRAFT_673955 [Daedalea quercina L-15889]|uniref:Mid2 domain-containing protein n=1 Tax=Daedalea quercina L-15889 TaxID=1314783 RepID=A0A165NKW9_9APHY|nr:hypothetical protein DAEQUDRAFT_673955 [Daedalea quercina L-15889]
MITSSANSTSSAVISFPSQNTSTSLSFTSLSTLTSTTSYSRITPSQNSQTFLTQTTLILASSSSSSSPPSSSLTDPDQPTSTSSIPSTIVSASASPSQAALPANLPVRIYPSTQAQPDDIDGDYTLISLLYKSSLNWVTVANNTESSAQIFEWMPTILQYALNVSESQVQQYALQPWEPETYTGPEDEDELLTVWLAYIPSDQVNNLAEQIKVPTSSFYTALVSPYSTLAEQVDPSFQVDSVSVSGTGGSSSGSGSNTGSSSSNAASSSGSSASETRKNAIIGVVTSLGAVALIALAFLSIRAIKKRRELAHQRLAEPADMYDGSRPDGQEFDRDSVGGQRRRSFYFAADSLRGFSEVANSAAAFDQRVSPDSGMRERRGVMPGAISTPILRENTMNW